MAEKAHGTANELKGSHGAAIDSLEARMIKLEASAYPLSRGRGAHAGKDDAQERSVGCAHTVQDGAAQARTDNVFANWTAAQEHLVQVKAVPFLCAKRSQHKLKLFVVFFVEMLIWTSSLCMGTSGGAIKLLSLVHMRVTPETLLLHVHADVQPCRKIDVQPHLLYSRFEGENGQYLRAPVISQARMDCCIMVSLAKGPLAEDMLCSNVLECGRQTMVFR